MTRNKRILQLPDNNVEFQAFQNNIWFYSRRPHFPPSNISLLNFKYHGSI